VTEFFGDPPSGPFDDENIEALFLEWVIYEHKQQSGITFLTEYILRNPHQLPERTIEQLKPLRKVIFIRNSKFWM